MVESSRRAYHGPKFLRLTPEQRQQLYRMHQNLGHPDSQILGNVLRDQGWESDAIEGIKDMHCPSCFENQKPKIARPGHLGTPRSFNDLVSIDAVKWTSAEGMSFTFYHMLDAGTNFQVAFLCESGSSKEVASQMQAHWFSWAGPPRQLMCDSAGEFCSEEFSRFFRAMISRPSSYLLRPIGSSVNVKDMEPFFKICSTSFKWNNQSPAEKNSKRSFATAHQPRIACPDVRATVLKSWYSENPDTGLRVFLMMRTVQLISCQRK